MRPKKKKMSSGKLPISAISQKSRSCAKGVFRGIGERPNKQSNRPAPRKRRSGGLKPVSAHRHRLPISGSRKKRLKSHVFFSRFLRWRGRLLALGFQLRDALTIHKMGGVLLLNVLFAELGKTQRDHRLFALPAFFLDRPLLVIAKGWFQVCFPRIDPYLMADRGQLAQIDGTDPFQVWDAPVPPVFVMLFFQIAQVHQHVHRRGVAPIPALVVHGAVDLCCKLMVVHIRITPSHYCFPASKSNQLQEQAFSRSVEKDFKKKRGLKNIL